MSATLSQWSIPVLAGLLLVTMPGCSKKSVQSGGDTQSSQSGMAKGTPGVGGSSGSTGSVGSDGSAGSAGSVGSVGSDGSRGGGVSSNFPDTSLAGRDGSGGLRGLDKNPGEERVNGGTMMAKLDPSQSGRQMDEIRSEQAAADAAGLRDVFFGYDSFAISEEGRQALARNAEWIKANPGSQLKIEGHCDERGTSAYNLVLGEKRAKAARNYLVELGVSANRLGIVSYGKERPFCKDHSESCYAQNRRGHVVVKSGK